MGLFSSSQTTTQSSVAAELSTKGGEYESLYNELLAMEFETLGYDVKTSTKEVYKDQKRADSLQTRIDKYKNDISKIEAKLSDKNLQKENYALYNQLLVEKNNANSYLLRDEQTLAKLDKETYTDFDVTKLEDIRVRNAIEKYGENSAQVKDARNAVKAEEVFGAESKAEVTKNYLTSLKKFTSGDYSYTKEQESQINKFIDPVKKVLNKTSSDLLDKLGDDYSRLSTEFDKVSDQINQTNFDTFSALEAAQVQIEKSGADLMTVLENVNKSSEARAMFQFDLLSKQADTAIDNQNAMLGLPPNSQMAYLQKAEMKNNIMKSLQLELAEQTAKGTMDIQKGVESGKNQISLQKVLLASTTGEKKEALAKAGVDLLSSYLGKEESVISNKNQALLGLEQTKSQQLANVAFGNVAQMIGVGQSGLSFDKQMTAADLSNASAVAGQVNQPLSFEKNLQTYEGTTTSKTSKSPSFFDVVTDTAGAAASIGSLFI